MLMSHECAVLLFCLCSGGCSPLASYSKAAPLWQHGTGRAQHGLTLALDQADLGPDITSIAAASPLLAFCWVAQLTMPCLSAVVSSTQGGRDANLTEGWLTTASIVVDSLIFMRHCFQCPTSLRDLTALLTSCPMSRKGIFIWLNGLSSRTTKHVLLFYIFWIIEFSQKYIE